MTPVCASFPPVPRGGQHRAPRPHFQQSRPSSLIGWIGPLPFACSAHGRINRTDTALVQKRISTEPQTYRIMGVTAAWCEVLHAVAPSNAGKTFSQYGAG